uniref:Uncharacterized protein n=1 Tax=viral metagenome TaxID=1070528 RepID=A0A6C0LMR3_9ZZZZ
MNDTAPTMNDAATTATTAPTTHVLANAKCSGVFWQQHYEAYSYRYNVANSTVLRNGIMGDYHLFLRSGDKVYVDVKNVGDAVMSFAELQKNKYLKYYYGISLLLANNRDIVIQNTAFNKAYDEIYEETKKRTWSFETAYINYNMGQTYKETYEVIPSGNVCYFKINPADVEKMEYTSPQGLELFHRIYMCRKDVRFGYFLNRAGIYKKIATDYQMAKKHMLIDNMATLKGKYHMNDDILTMLYNNVIKGDTYEYITSKEESDALLLEEYPDMDDDDDNDIFKTIYNERLSGVDAYTAYTAASAADTT